MSREPLREPMPPAWFALLIVGAVLGAIVAINLAIFFGR